MKKRGKNLLKVVSTTLATALTLGVIGNYDLITSHAHMNMANSNEQIVCSNDNNPNLRNNYSADNVLCKKLEYDKKNNVTTLSKDVEKQLNEVGVFDSEIEELDSSEISELNNASNINVYISYYSIDDDSNEKTPMTDYEISSIIDDCIQDGTVAYEESYTTNLLAKLNLTPNVAYAYKDDDESLSKSGSVKQTIVVSQKNKGAAMNVTYTATWLKEAKHRETDVLGLTFPGATLDEKSLKCTHTAKFKRESNVSGIKVSKDMKTNPSVYEITNNSFVYKINLFGNRTEMDNYKRVGRIESYKNETIKITFKCKVMDRGLEHIPFTNYYYHANTEIKLNPSISLGTDSIGVSLSPSKQQYLKPLVNGQFCLEYDFI